MPNKTDELKLAVLIDADNVSGKYLKDVMTETVKYGTPTIKRIYGDWTNPSVTPWKALLLQHAITPIQQYSYTTGKNSTDSAMIIDAMDILYSGNTDGFVLVSSDSDFTRLAIRLREAGMKVFGMGEKKTPNPFITACDQFFYIDVIHAAANKKPVAAVPAGRQQSTDDARTDTDAEAQVIQHAIPKKMLDFIASSIDDIADDDGYAFLGDLGNLLLKKQPDFDPRNYGFSKLSEMMKGSPRFDVDVRKTPNPHIKHVYIRNIAAK